MEKSTKEDLGGGGGGGGLAICANASLWEA